MGRGSEPEDKSDYSTSELDNDVTSMLRRPQVIKSRRRVSERENLLVHNRLQVDLVFREELAQVLLVFGGSDTNTPVLHTVSKEESQKTNTA
jgi:hypothetical protein